MTKAKHVIRCVHPECATELDGDSNFCTNCGSPQFDACPNNACRVMLRLNTRQCSNSACQRFLRFCPKCRKLHLISQDTCVNQGDWDCEGTRLVDFLQGYTMVGGSLERGATWCQSGSSQSRFPVSTQEVGEPVWIYKNNGAITDVITAYGHLYFVSYATKSVHRIPETIAETTLGAGSADVQRSDPLAIPDNSVVRDLSIVGPFLTFLVGQQPSLPYGATPTYPICDVYRIEVDTLTVRDKRKAAYQTQVLAAEKWVLISYDATLQQSIVDVLDTATGKAIVEKLPVSEVVNEQVPPVVVQQALFMATRGGNVYRLDLRSGTLAKMRWQDSPGDASIVSMVIGNGRLRVLVSDRLTRQINQLFSLDLASLSGFQRVPLSLPPTTRYEMWLLANTLFLCYVDHEKHVMQGYDLENEMFYPTIQCTIRALDGLERLLPLQVGERQVFLQQIKGSEGTTTYSLQPSDSAPPIKLSRQFWALPQFVYSNGQVFLSDRKSGEIVTVRVLSQ